MIINCIIGTGWDGVVGRGRKGMGWCGGEEEGEIKNSSDNLFKN